MKHLHFTAPTRAAAPGRPKQGPAPLGGVAAGTDGGGLSRAAAPGRPKPGPVPLGGVADGTDAGGLS
jgi:hypothetical protein